MPIANEDVEAVARAIAPQFNVDPDVFIGMHGRDKWEKQWHPIARAARAVLSAAPIERMREALAYFAGERLSTEPGVSDCLARSPAMLLREQAQAVERRDQAIRDARASLIREQGDGN